MEVSIVVPVYNVEKYLRRCVDSILAQTFTDFELILVDDGSTDGCGNICDEYAENNERIRVFHQENAGVSAARNLGLEKAEGCYVAFCDSDDYCLPDWLEKMVFSIKENCCDLAIASYQYVDEDGKQTSLRSRYPGYWEIEKKEEKFEYIITHVLDKRDQWNGWELWTSLFKNELIKTNNIKMCETCDNFAEDLGFVLEYLLYADSVVCIEDYSYCYVQHDKSMMAKSVDTVKLNSLNEVSAHFGKVFFQQFPEVQYKWRFSLLHFMIMNDQYEKIWYGEDTRRLPEEVKKIKNRGWFDKNCRKLSLNKARMAALFGKKKSKEYLLWNRYCRHLNWKIFSIESAIMYRFFLKGNKHVEG